MSDIKLIQKIRAVSQALQQAKDSNDTELVESLTDELADLNAVLEDESQQDYDCKHNHGWH